MKRNSRQSRKGSDWGCRWALVLWIAVAATNLTRSASAASSDPPFEPPYRTLEAGEGPSAVVIADLNGDGYPDLAVANLFSNTVSVLLGLGSGDFATRRDFAAGGGPYALAAGDLNGDHKLDLAVANSGANSVGVMWGQGDGGFAATTQFATGAEPVSVAMADLNADHALDLVTANDKDNSVSILLADGVGGFRSRSDLGVGAFPGSVAVSDLDADGTLDLAVANTNSSTVSVMLGHGDGSFATRVDYSTQLDPAYQTYPSAVTIADANGDGLLDLVVANLYGVFGTASVLLGVGGGVFGLPTYSQIAFNYGVSLGVGDLDADGRPDVAMTDPVSGTIIVARFDSYGQATFDASYSAGVGVTALAIADVNLDHRLDLVAVGQNTATITVLIANERRGFGSQSPMGRDHVGAAMTDLNGDQAQDLVMVAPYGDSVWTLPGAGDGSFGDRTGFATAGNTRSVVVGDLNGDAHPDLAVLSGYYPSWVSILLGSGDGTFASRSDYNVVEYANSLILDDVNADRRPDLIVVSSYQNVVSIMLNAGNGTFSTRRDSYLPDQFYPTAVASGDLDGDGHADLLVGGAGVAVLHGRGDGTFGAGVVESGTWVLSVALADLNGDRRLDLVAGTSPDSVVVALGDGQGGFGPRATFQVGPGPVVALEDLDGDAVLDLVSANSSGTSLSLFRGHSDGSFTPWQVVAMGSPPRLAGIADLNGDEKPDLVVLANRTVTLLVNRTPRHQTATLLSTFVGGWDGAAILLRWQFGERERLVNLRIERATSRVGPWIVAEGERQSEGTTETLSDHHVEPGRTYYYRLVTSLPGGAEAVFGPLEVASGPSQDPPVSFSVSPNPCSGPARIDFTVVRDEHVRVSVADVQGRRVAVLADGSFARGRHQLIWDGRNPSVPPGMYFVRYDVSGQTLVRRLVVARRGGAR